MTRPLKPPTDRREINLTRRRVRDLERRVPAGERIYIGVYPTDPNTTTDSPEPQNGWVNSGDGTPETDALTSFCWEIGLGAKIDMVVNMTGGTPGSIMFSLPPEYWPLNGKHTFDAVTDDGIFTCFTVVPRDDGSGIADVYDGRV